MDIAASLSEALNCGWAVATGLFVFAVGLFYVLKFCYDVGRFFFRFLLPPIRFKRFGNWVVVTGATDGIGKAYVTEFAKQGLNVYLLSRNESRLNETASELRQKFSIETKQTAVDFSSVSDDQWNGIKDTIDALDVGILVNNVGCSYDHPDYLHAIDDAIVHRLIELNVRTTIQMTRAVLPGMLKRKKGVVVCVGSGAGSLLPSSPLLSVYAGTKAFVEQFAKSCNSEYKEKGIQFQAQAPLYVTTKMSKIRRSSLTVPTPKIWVRSALQQIGNGPLTSGYWIHNIMWAAVSCLPVTLMNGYTLSIHKTIRNKALKKKEATKRD